MQFCSDNTASVHPAVWAAMHAADAADLPYDGDLLSQRLDDAFSDLFEQECAALWVATGTAANCMALACMVPPYGGVICHREAHIETSECGAPGFFTHGAKLMLLDGDHAKVTPEAIATFLSGLEKEEHQIQPHAISITQATEAGCVYDPGEVARIAAIAQAGKLALHMDGARFANAVAHLGCAPAQACAGVDALSFGFIKNGGLGAEALVFFDPELADTARYRRRRAGHTQSKGRYLAAQILALLDSGLWFQNAAAANAAAQEIGAAAADRLLYPVEANEVFMRISPEESAALRARGFDFYDWGKDAARFVTAWDSDPADAAALGRSIREIIG